MKKTLIVIMAFCLMAGWSAAVLVDDFESYSTGLVTAVTGGKWVPVVAGAGVDFVSIGTDPVNSSNKVLQFTEGLDPGGGGYGIVPAGAVIANGTTKTLFYRFRTSASSGTAPNTCLGLTDVDAIPINSWAQFCTMHRLNLGATQARNGGVWDPIPGVALSADTWYNVWVQVNHTANTYKIYMNSTPGANGNATTDRIGIAAADAFRLSNTNDLDRFIFLSIGTAVILIDDIHIVSGESLVNQSQPLGAHDPAPADGAANVSTSTATLSWAAGVDPANPANPNPAITKHYVYMREGDPNLTGQLKQTVSAGSPTQATASCAMPLTLAIDKTYYWRVDESVNDSSATDPNTIKGSVWSFATEKSTPVVTMQPANVRVFAPAETSFTVEFTCISTPTVVWQKNGGALSGGVVTTTGPVGITYTTTLTFVTTADSDQAEYSCLLYNANNEPANLQPNAVTLVTKKLLAHYAFEDNLTDSVTVYGPHHGTAKTVADPNITTSMTYETGLVGSKAVKFDGTAIVDLGTDAYPRTGLGNGMEQATLTCWVKATQIGGLITNYNDNIPANPSAVPPQPAANTTGFGMAIAGNGDGRVHLRGETAPGTLPIAESFMGQAQGIPVKTPPFNMLDGNWHQVAVTWQQGYQMVVYVDGVQVASTPATMPIYYAPWQYGIVLGGIRTIADRAVIGELYNGLMDDLRVYNYMQSAHEIADLYSAATGLGVCTETYTSAYDYDKNCVVDLADFSVLAAAWLDCGLYPTATCP